MKKIVSCFLSIVFLSFNALAKEISLECFIVFEGKEYPYSILLDTDKMTVGYNNQSFELFSSTDTYYFKEPKIIAGLLNMSTFSISREDLSFIEIFTISSIRFPELPPTVREHLGSCKIVENTNLI